MSKRSIRRSSSSLVCHTHQLLNHQSSIITNIPVFPPTTRLQSSTPIFKMEFPSVIVALTLAVVASALPAPMSTGTPPSTGSCSSPQVLACCSSFSGGFGLGCIFSSEPNANYVHQSHLTSKTALNILNPTCTASQSLACCSGTQVRCFPW